MKVLVPLVLCGFILCGFFAVSLAVFLAPSDSYILDQLSDPETITITEAATTQVYAILVVETTEVQTEGVQDLPDLTDNEVIE